MTSAWEQTHTDYSNTRIGTRPSNGRGESTVRTMKGMTRCQKETVNTLGIKFSMMRPHLVLLTRHSEWLLNHLVRSELQVEAGARVVKTSPYRSHTGNPLPRATDLLKRILVPRPSKSSSHFLVEIPFVIRSQWASLCRFVCVACVFVAIPATVFPFFLRAGVVFAALALGIVVRDGQRWLPNADKKFVDPVQRTCGKSAIDPYIPAGLLRKYRQATAARTETAARTGERSTGSSSSSGGEEESKIQGAEIKELRAKMEQHRKQQRGEAGQEEQGQVVLRKTGMLIVRRRLRTKRSWMSREKAAEATV